MDGLGPILIVSIVSPTVLAVLTWVLRRADTREDWRRQDAVAARVAEVQTSLEASDESTNAKLDQIHTLVNSQMTAAIEAELGAVERELVLMKHVIDLNVAAGRETQPESIAAVEVTQAKIDELRATLADRLRKDLIARAQLEHGQVDPEPAEQAQR